MIKRCEIYKTDKGFKIITQNTSNEGFGMVAKPTFMLPIDCEGGDLLEALRASLRESKNDVYFPKIKKEYENYIDDILYSIQEKSFKNLYESNGCLLEQSENKIIINVYKLYNPSKSSEGIVFDETRVKVFELEKKNEEEFVLQLLDSLENNQN